MPVLLLLVLAFLGGAVLPFQVGINSQLRQWLGSPVLASLVSFAVGAAGLAVFALVLRLPVPGLNRLSVAPLWVWAGGLLGAFYVFVTIFVAPRLGATVLAVLIVAGQVMTSLAVDHFGLAGFVRHPVTLWRLVGAAVVLAGVAMIRKN